MKKQSRLLIIGSVILFMLCACADSKRPAETTKGDSSIVLNPDISDSQINDAEETTTAQHPAGESSVPESLDLSESQTEPNLPEQGASSPQVAELPPIQKK